MMKLKHIATVLLCLLLNVGGVRGSDHEAAASYYRSSAFNAPILEGWAKESGADFAQFELAGAQASIRTALVTAADGLAAAQADLSDFLGVEIGQPIYSYKVNLADGTWNVLVFDIDAATTASVMARRADSGFVVISFVERNPAARTVMLVITQADDARDEADPEILSASEALTGIDLTGLAGAEVIDLASGAWRLFRYPELTAVGMVFGNESYVALQAGEPGDLAALADAFNRTLLGFFITPDNSRYLALGLAVTFTTLGTLLLSYFWRFRSLQKDLSLLNELAETADA